MDRPAHTAEPTGLEGIVVVGADSFDNDETQDGRGPVPKRAAHTEDRRED